MGKKSQRVPVQHERDQSGCMWGLISMFDFRHSRTTQKLLADRRRASRHAVAVEIPKDKLDMLTDTERNCQGIVVSVCMHDEIECLQKLLAIFFQDGKESTIATSGVGKPSMKKLMEEEMVRKQGVKKLDSGEVDTKHSNSDSGGQQKKNCKKTKRSSTKSRHIRIGNLDIAEKLEFEQPCLQKLEKRSRKRLDIDPVLEEFCHQIHQKSVNCMVYDQHTEKPNQPNQKNPNLEEKLSEAIKLLMNQKLINGKNGTEDGNIYTSKEVRDALQILSSHEELFLKFLQGPQSDTARDEDSNSLAGPTLPVQEIDDLRQSDEVIQYKDHGFFRRKAKSRGKSPSKGNNSSRESNRIVILKPGRTSSQNHETDGSLYSLPDSQFIFRTKGPDERVSSHFFLAEIKRKLKHAMGKERQEISTYGVSKKFTNKHQAVGNSVEVFKENIGIKSPSKDHFFSEKIARPPMGIKKGEKTGKPIECEISAEHQIVDYPKQKLLNIYIEAKKHLSEMQCDGAGDIDFSSRQIPESLGGILSLPEYMSTPIGSPGRDLAQSLATAQVRSSSSDKFQKQENNVNHLGRTTLNIETQSQDSDEVTGNETQSPPKQNSNVSNELVRDNEEERTFHSTGGEITSEDEVENVPVAEIVIQEESNMFNPLFEPSSCPNTINDENGVISEFCDEKGYSKCLENELYEQNEPLPSPLAFPSKKDEDPKETVEMLELISPGSVLGPIFTEGDISPASSKFQPVESPIQPLRILFEENNPSVVDQGIYLKSSVGAQESVFEYIKAVLRASDMKLDELYMRSHSSDQLLDPSIFDEVEFFPNQLFCDNKVLFDLINEVLIEVYGHYFGCFSGLSNVKPKIRPVPDMTNAVSEVWDGVYWYLHPLPLPHSLDQIVKKDMAKTGTWMDLRYDSKALIVEIGEAIFGDLIEETVAN